MYNYFVKFVFVFAALLVPVSAVAAIVPECTEGGIPGLCQACNIVQLVDNLLKFFVFVAVAAAAVMFAYAGILAVTASANKNNLASAKKIFLNTFLGLVFVVAAFLVIDLLIRTFVPNQTFNVFTRIDCVRMIQTSGGFEFEDTGTGEITSPIGEVASSGDYCSGANWSTYENQFRSAVRANPNVANITATDITSFCPRYNSLTSQQKEDVAVRLFSSMARYESGCNPNADSLEPSSSFPNPDPLTGQPVRSEGLCQLSYQDEQWYKQSNGTCDFDYAARDIRDPTKNINCCVYIMSRQFDRTNTVATPGSYWSILRNGQYSKLPQIRAAVRQVPGCL